MRVASDSCPTPMCHTRTHTHTHIYIYVYIYIYIYTHTQVCTERVNCSTHSSESRNEDCFRCVPDLHLPQTFDHNASIHVLDLASLYMHVYANVCMSLFIVDPTYVCSCCMSTYARSCCIYIRVHAHKHTHTCIHINLTGRESEFCL